MKDQPFSIHIHQSAPQCENGSDLTLMEKRENPVWRKTIILHHFCGSSPADDKI